MGWIKIKNNPALLLTLILSIFCINIVLCGPVAAATIHINDSSAYDTSNISLNQQIQDIIDSAAKGDTLEFLGSYYENLSLVINKSLNIVSRVQTTISSNLGNPIFLVKGSGSSGTNITGFNLKANDTDGIVIQNTGKVTISKNNLTMANGTGIRVTGSSNINIDNNRVSNSKTGLSVTNSKNVAVTRNTVKKSANNGVNVAKSQNVTVSKNRIQENGNDGVSAEDSETVTVEENTISNNGNNAVTLKNTTKTKINNNSIDNNQGNGIYFNEKVNDTQIKGNNITNNRGIGVALDKSGANSYINSNIIRGNRIGININDSSDNLVITQNLITNSIHTGGDEVSGVGINFGQYYWSFPTLNVNNNAIFDNQRREVEIRDTNEPVVFGANWYGHSLWSGCNLCPKLQTKLITAEVTQSGDIYTVTLYTDYDNAIIAGQLPSFEAYFYLSDGSRIKVLVENGKASLKTPLKVNMVKTTNQRHYPENIRNVPQNPNQEDDENPVVPGSDNGGTGGPGDGGGGSGDGSGGAGTGGGSGAGSGNSAGGTTSGSSSPPSIGAMANAAIQGSTDSSPGESGSSRGSRGSVQELFIDDTVKNPQVWSIIGVVVLILLVIMAYYRNDLRNMIRNSK